MTLYQCPCFVDSSVVIYVYFMLTFVVCRYFLLVRCGDVVVLAIVPSAHQENKYVLETRHFCCL